MNDKGLQKKQLPLRLSLNLNRNKESVDNTFTTASKLVNAPIYNNAISNYFERHVENAGPTVYDENNNSYTVNANGDVINVSVPLFKIDLHKFVKEDVSFDKDMVVYDKLGESELKVYNKGTYLNIEFLGKEYSYDTSLMQTFFAIKGKIFHYADYDEAVIPVVYVNADGKSYWNLISISSETLHSDSFHELKWDKGGTVHSLNELNVNDASTEYKDLEALYNNKINKYDPLIQIVQSSENKYGISFLLKKGLLTDDEFIFSTLFYDTSNIRYSDIESLGFVFDNQSSGTVTKHIKLQVALVAEGPFHYFDRMGNLNAYEILMAGTYVRAYARYVDSVDIPVSVKINWSWSANRGGGSNFFTGYGDLPKKYGGRVYNNGVYSVVGGDGKTNFNRSNGIDYSELFQNGNPSIGLDAYTTSWRYSDTERLKKDTQVALISRSDYAPIYKLQKLFSNGIDLVHPYSNVFGRNTTKPVITTIQVSYGTSTQTVNVNNGDNCFIYYDPFHDCDKDSSNKYRCWFSDNQRYENNVTSNFWQGNTSCELKYLGESYQTWLTETDENRKLPETHMDEYLNDFTLKVLSKWSLNQDGEYCPVWCYNNSISNENKLHDIISMYDEVIQTYLIAYQNKHAEDYNTKVIGYNGRYVESDFEFEETSPFLEGFNKEPKYISSDGYLYNSDYRKFNDDHENYAYALKATINSVEYDGSKFNVHWGIVKHVLINENNENRYHKCTVRFVDDGVYTITIAHSHPDTPYSDASPTHGQDWSEDDMWYFTYYDSCMDKIVANCGVVAIETQVPYGAMMYSLNKYYHTNGLSVSKGKWNVLYNSSTEGASLAGVSYSNDDNRGTLLTPWFSVDNILYFDDDSFVYKDTSGNFHKISIEEGYDIKIYFDRFIIINTVSFHNAYDMKEKKICHFADDWNNRICFGREAQSIAFIETGNPLSLLIISSVGEQYTIDDSVICSALANPVPLSYWNGYNNYFTYKTNSDIDLNVYSSIGTTTYPEYQFSLNKMNKLTDNKFIGLTYPISSNGVLYLNPDLFMRQLRSYTNADLFYENDLSYAVTYYSNKPVFIYNLTTIQKDLSAVFIIQSQRYGVINDKIVSLTYSNNVITSVEAVTDIKGLKYIGYLPSASFFYSPKERKIYQFTGDADLTELVECTEIEDITNTYYDTATKTLYWLTPKGFYCFNGDYCWFIKAENVDTFYTSNTDILIKFKDYDTTFLRLEKDSDESIQFEYHKLPYEIETSYYGSSENRIGKLSSLYVQTLNDFVENDDWVKITSNSQSDIDVKSDSKDFERKSILSYIPKYDIGIGTSFNIKGTVPIKAIVLDINPIGATQKSNMSMEVR